MSGKTATERQGRLPGFLVGIYTRPRPKRRRNIRVSVDGLTRIPRSLTDEQFVEALRQMVEEHYRRFGREEERTA